MHSMTAVIQTINRLILYQSKRLPGGCYNDHNGEGLVTVQAE